MISYIARIIGGGAGSACYNALFEREESPAD
jgi:hypothetical protein